MLKFFSVIAQLLDETESILGLRTREAVDDCYMIGP